MWLVTVKNPATNQVLLRDGLFRRMEDVFNTVKPILIQAGAPFAQDMTLIQLYQSNCDSSNYYKSRQEIASWVSMKKQTKAAIEKARREMFQAALYPKTA